MNPKIARKVSLFLTKSVVPQSIGCSCQGQLVWLGLVLILLFGWSLTDSTTAYLQEAIAPVSQSDLAQDRIYAYRGWQSVGVRVQEGDLLDIKAEGRWLYTPNEYHGPEGHPRFSAPSFYPARGAGGTLIGRIGERGQIFLVGRGLRMMAMESGVLYMRINDDVLSDNDGQILAKVSIEALE